MLDDDGRKRVRKTTGEWVGRLGCVQVSDSELEKINADCDEELDISCFQTTRLQRRKGKRRVESNCLLPSVSHSVGASRQDEISEKMRM